LAETNQILEEKNHSLNHQKEKIEQANKELEFSRIEVEQKAEEVARASQYKSEFLANMSHEIRTPLNGILGVLELSLDTELNTIQLNYLRKANLSAKTLLNIINDVLDISKIEAGQMQLERVPFALEQVLDHITSQFTMQAKEKDIDFSMTYLWSS